MLATDNPLFKSLTWAQIAVSSLTFKSIKPKEAGSLKLIHNSFNSLPIYSFTYESTPMYFSLSDLKEDLSSFSSAEI